MRVFVAVDISEEARLLIARRIEFLRARFSNLRVGWEKPEKLHLTLKFLGDMTEKQLQDLIVATEKSAHGVSPFELQISGVGAFPPRGNARVLWLGVKDATAGLKELNKRLEDECFAIGFEREKRDFKPHLTIARLKEPNKSRDLVKLHLETDFPAISFPVSELTIYKSELTRSGSIYSTLYNGKLITDNG